MPPPLPLESENESVIDDVLTTDTKGEPEDTKMKDEVGDQDEEEGQENEEDEEIFIVEAIVDHRSDFEDGQMRYHVKWKGYEKKSDRTWETEENLEGASDILKAYWASIGGKPVPGAPKSSKKRGRQSGASAKSTPVTTKRPRMSKGGRKSNGAIEQDIEPGSLVGFTEVGEDNWKPPPAKDGSWDALVQSIDTVVRENADGELWAYLIWNEKNEEGRFYRSKAKLPVIYKACPQRMLHFYEKHLVFSTSNDAEATDAGGKAKTEGA
ncbi:MAG: hypothetical protein Q9217_001048 [Psora testacea]